MTRQMPETIPLSYLNALEYCPRRFFYEFVQGEMLTNEFVEEGSLLHQHADDPGQRSEDGELRIRRLYLHSSKLRLAGFADIVLEQDDRLIPLEYKRGKEGKWLNDHIQLCAQALCLEELRPDQSPLAYGYIFYFGSRRRVQVAFTDELRAKTLATIDRAVQIAMQEQPPRPLERKAAARCKDCSLQELCLPNEVLQLLT
jgi:CRISPR-associated protein Cas4